MVAPGRTRRALLLDQFTEGVGRPVHDGRVGERALEHDDSGAVQQGPDQLGLYGPTALRCGRQSAEPFAVVERHVPIDPLGRGMVGGVGVLLDECAERVEIAVGLGQPGP